MSLPTSTLIASRPAAAATTLLRRLRHVVRGDEVEARLPQHLLAPFLVVALHADDHRHLHAQVAHGRDHALRQHVAAQDAAEDVDEDRLHVLVGHQDAERVADLLRVGAAAHVEEVGGAPPASLMMSMVAMARPAPFTMQPTLPPSSLM